MHIDGHYFLFYLYFLSLYYSLLIVFEIISFGRLYYLQVLFQESEKNVINICSESLKVQERVCVCVF